MITYRDLAAAFKGLNLPAGAPVIVHASLSAFGEIRGGAETLLGALLANFSMVMMPVFTFKTMVIPEEGPENNALKYGSGKDSNRLAEFFYEDMPADALMGELAEVLRKNPAALRSSHPILSFCGIGVKEALESQRLEEPLAPIMCLTDQQGWVLLLGVDHTVNTSLHLAEQHSGRKTFTRWALSPTAVLPCPNYPGCSDGFEQAATLLAGMTRQTQVGEALIQALPLDPMLQTVAGILRDDPLALLCERDHCPRCDAVRAYAEALTKNTL